jgi:hypothetical protein
MNGNADRRDWNKVDDVGAAVVDVLRHILAQPPEVTAKCLSDDQFARSLFEDPKIGNIDVPENTKTVFLHPGERERKEKGSVIIEMPVPGTPAQTEEERQALLGHVLCCYRIWIPGAE